jgi:arylsulfatase A-like enzyme
MLALLTVSAAERPNVLFIGIDDLRTQSPLFGQCEMITPGMERLAKEAIVFSRAYVSVPVCGASRASLMSGARPTQNRFWNYYSRKDKDYPNHPSIAMWFKENGYTTKAAGKIYHFPDDDKAAWSDGVWARPDMGLGWQCYLTEESRAMVEANRTKEKPYQVIGPATEAADVPDNAYHDGALADHAISQLKPSR